ncbi:MAG: hypothetical protein A3F91_09310 [Flavobacteria bacterium RIFCSPLOWO2_12_FULL_35_11]|nr:MAG: hypothetical protein A3F91_09310 [Flavobacteria bacterium RIFCSPLOWO2_12_FULL_35_11]
MLKQNILFFMLFFWSCILDAADYLVPYEYDNMLQSVKSQGYGVITPASGVGSTNYTINGVSAQYQCLADIPKISCRSATNVIYANVSEVILLHSLGGIVHNFGTDLRTEDGGSFWRVCGAAVGGLLSDTLEMDGNTVVYTPNSVKLVQNYFTNSAVTPAGSYMAVSYQQICK